MQHCDLVLIEGFKSGSFPRLEVWRPAVGQPPLAPRIPHIIAMATDGADALAPPGLARLDLGDIRVIADFVLAHAVGGPARWQAGP